MNTVNTIENIALVICTSVSTYLMANQSTPYAGVAIAVLGGVIAVLNVVLGKDGKTFLKIQSMKKSQ